MEEKNIYVIVVVMMRRMIKLKIVHLCHCFKIRQIFLIDEYIM